ncbi:MAG: hypothetical protein LJE70_10095 [Chromatiaceae bacterium]|jgi:hypothetical protein|nr:hypothetical protein [Chromatiaceae bacterium]
MILKAIIDDKEYSLEVPEAVIARGEEFFSRLDADMDKGWQMSREWVQNPGTVERCQIVADKLLTALENANQKLGMLMAGYILSRMPEVDTVEIDIAGEMQNTQFIMGEPKSVTTPVAPAEHTQPIGGTKLNKLEAMEQAGNDVTKVFKVGKAFRFSVFDHGSGTWQDSPTIATEQEAERLRQEAFKARFESLQSGD